MAIDHIVQEHFIGIDVGTGSARACLIDSSGDIKALASEPIKLWQPQTGYYVRHRLPTHPCLQLTRARLPGTIHYGHLGLHL